MTKKRIIILLLIALVIALPAMADGKGAGQDMGAGKSKLGTIIGRGLFVTYGFDVGKATEINIHGGVGWNFYSFTVGANMLFTLVDINIEDQIFPLSLGPQVDLTFGNGYINMGVFAVLRWEYTFWFPLNLFVEVGPGINFNFNGFNPSFDWRGGVGVRYVFGM